jgi:redox-sensing transcriptional repressor
MSTETVKGFPIPSVRRLPLYLRLLRELRADGHQVVSCTQISENLGQGTVQVRKDLAITGIVGRPKVGYQIPELIDAIETFLGWKNTRDAFLVGAGSMGSALLGYEGFRNSGLNIVAAFDTDPAKIGTRIHGKEVLDWNVFHDLAQRMHILIGILTVPADIAQEVTNAMILAGIRAIWNYTPATLEVPPAIVVEDVRLSSSLAALSSRLTRLLESQR